MASPPKRSREPTPAKKNLKKSRPADDEEEVKIEPGSGTFISYDNLVSQMHHSWQRALQPWMERGSLQRIYNWVAEEYRNFPCRPVADEIFTAFRLTPFDQVKVVVVGQDPYPGPTEAMGLSFSVHRDVKIPGSLRNIYKCLQTDPKIDFTPPRHGDLSDWAKQGVFMLNAVLTLRQGKANSHAGKGWEFFTDQIIKLINEQRTGVVFMLWGSFAQAKAKEVNTSKHLVLKACHPSPLSASKGGFFNCGHFSAANEYLRSKEKTPINWSLN